MVLSWYAFAGDRGTLPQAGMIPSAVIKAGEVDPE